MAEQMGWRPIKTGRYVPCVISEMGGPCISLKERMAEDGVITEMVFNANKTGSVRMVGPKWKAGHRFTWKQKNNDMEVILTLQDWPGYENMYNIGQQMRILSMGRDIIVNTGKEEGFFPSWKIEK